jgi:transcriptional antiterminator NusG
MAHKWYIVHTYSGFEHKVKVSIEERIKQYGMEEYFSGIVVPMEKVVEILKGERRTPKVTGFIGGLQNPAPLSDEEAEKIIRQMEERALKPVPKYSFEKGDHVIVTDGPFTNFNGVVDNVSPERGKIRVLISVFGRSTPVELEFGHVQKAG